MARSKMKILGIGKRVNGISQKTNNPYDFTPVSFVFPRPGFDGFCGVTVNVDTPEIPAGLAVNAEVDVVYHYIKDKMYVDAIL